MVTIAISDLHGTLPKITEPFDLMLIAGDVCPVWDHRRPFQEEWLRTEFAEWVRNLPFKDTFGRVVMCAGNHDFVFESIGKTRLSGILKACDDRLVYLDNEEYEFECLGEHGIDTYKIFGCPYCKVFGNWAFMRENLDKYYAPIPTGLDFLITHDAPGVEDYGIIQMGRHKGTDAGNHLLADYIKHTKPMFAFHGHIHSSPHVIKLINGTFYTNLSLLDENYDEVYEPLILDLKKTWVSDEFGGGHMQTSFTILNGTVQAYK